jgi:hypothetical protein
MMIWIVAAVLVAAVLLWPDKPKASPFAPKTGPSYLDAISAVQLVRIRLVATEQMTDECQKSIDCLTLRLVAGSEK